MATDFWASSHYKRWIVDRATLRQSRAEDLQYVDDPQYLDFLSIYFANIITKLGKKLGLRQRVIATATVFFRRFYLKNSYCETDPFVVIAACCYVAAKAEESPIQIKTIVSESRSLFSQENYNVKAFPSDNTKLAEMEFYLVDDLECDLTVFHPYRTLTSLCKATDSSLPDNESEEGEAGEVGVGIGSDDGPRYWGTGEGQLELSSGALQTAWFIINDTYRSDLCLLYPPHLIAIAAIYLTLILHAPTRTTLIPQLPSGLSASDADHSQKQAEESPPGPSTTTTTITPPQPRRSTRQAQQSTSSSSSSTSSTNGPDGTNKHKSQDPISFLADLNISLPLIATISQEIISLYTLWDRYKEDTTPEISTNVHSHSHSHSHSHNHLHHGISSTLHRTRLDQQHQESSSPFGVSTSTTGVTSTNKRAAVSVSISSSARLFTTLTSASTSSSASASTSTSNSTSASTSTTGGVGGVGGFTDYQDEYTLSPTNNTLTPVIQYITITPPFLSSVLYRMREGKLADAMMIQASGAGAGRSGVAVNKMLERTQAAG
ncbi:cyclin-like protein [Pluteus cervinus]|uniref:Cyclin-like protein n=1 Tax=Pluteus cervinus TaxID=181527 RepID=A0ACD3AEM5_9AGAR|nr:cyclin-like protein [Pluteus cervinus]